VTQERCIGFSGIGGQGVQLLAKVLARAALAEGSHAMMASEYGGEMRGGRSFAAVTLGAERLQSLPVAEHIDAVLLLHHSHAETLDPLLRPDALIVVEQDFSAQIARSRLTQNGARRFHWIAARNCAEKAGSAQGAGLALLGAYCALTGAARADNLVAAMEAIIPPYRRQHVAANERAIRAGWEIEQKASQP
jgi:Pyruvate/2-oxoacid:ferredoxin oxidoreductase gamma subunit